MCPFPRNPPPTATLDLIYLWLLDGDGVIVAIINLILLLMPERLVSFPRASSCVAQMCHSRVQLAGPSQVRLGEPIANVEDL